MYPLGSMMKPEPSDVTWRGALGLGPRRSLNKSSSGEPGGRFGMALCGGALSVCVVAMLTTVGRSCADRSAKDSGAPRAAAGVSVRERAIAAERAATRKRGTRILETFITVKRLWANSPLEAAMRFGHRSGAELRSKSRARQA